MGMSDLQFEVYNTLLTFVDELIDRENDEKEKFPHYLVWEAFSCRSSRFCILT